MKDDPAFPSVETYNEWCESLADYVEKTSPKGGLTKREYFTIKILQGLVTNPTTSFYKCVEDSVRFSDELLKRLSAD